MVRNNRMQIVLILLFFLGVIVLAQDKPVNKDKQLREEILAVYQSGGEKGLRDFVNKKKDEISNGFIIDFAKAGRRERKEEWLKICEIIAKEKKNKKTLADVLYLTGDYFRSISDFKKATNYFDKALPIYLTLTDPTGKGNVYLRKGDIYRNIGENLKALEMYNKAIPLFKKAKFPGGLGNVCKSKGDIYLRNGHISKAHEMYDKALTFFEIVKSPIGQGNVYLRKGDIYRITGEYSKALEKYDKALFLYKKGKSVVGQGIIHSQKGEIYFYTGDNKKAIEMNEKAFLFFKKAKDPRGQGNVYLKNGIIYSKIGKNSIAIEMYKKAMTFFKKSNDPVGQGQVYLNIGDIYLYTSENSKALEMYDKALPFFEKMGDSIRQGNVYLNKGIVYFYTGEHAKALVLYDKALYFYERSGASHGLSNVYFRKGEIYSTIGDNLKAFEMYDRALTFFEKAKSPVGLGNVYFSKGEIYFYTGDNLKAFEMYDKALSFFEKAESPVGQGNIYWSKGDIYFFIGENLKALEMYDKALPFFEIAGELKGQGNVYISKGNVYLKIGKTSKSLEMYDKALPFFEKAGQPIGQGNAYLWKGEIYLRSGDNSKALEMFNKALHFYKKVGEPIGQGNVYLKRGNVYLKSNENLKSILMYDNALSYYKIAGAIQQESIAFHGKAKAFVNLGKTDKALELYEKVIVNMEKVRAQTAFSEMKRSFLEKVYTQYEEAVLFMLENKYYEKAFRYAESMRARVFLDRMGEGLVRIDKGLTSDFKERRAKLVAKLSSLNKLIYETAGGKEEKKLEELKEQYRKIRVEFDELLIKIRLENPLYASVRYPEPISVRSSQKEILKKGEILVRYFMSSDKIYVFLVSKKKFKVVPLEIKKEEIDGLTERYLVAIKENNSRDMNRFGTTLYKRLFKPLEKSLKKNRDIIIIPDGQLAAIPFESLVIDKKESGQYVFLLEKYSIKYIQSASILSILRKYYQRDRKTKNFIGFGDPVYDYEKFKQEKPKQVTLKQQIPQNGDEIKEIHRGKYDREGGKYTRLKGSGEEVKAIVELFEKKNQKAALYLRADATEENAKTTDMNAFDYIHFGCHGILGDTFQCLVLSQDIPDAQDDGYFTLNEIMNCDYNAKLVVLSGCETGSGKMERTEGVTGLTRAVMYAGTPAVLASLWKVDDIATKELMVKFYRNLLEKNLDKTEALRQAKLELLKNKKYRAPLFWSAFVMYGE